MRALLTDENFDVRVVAGLRRRSPTVSITRVEDVGMRATEDTVILAWAAERTMTLLTHDVQTMLGFAYDRVRDGLPMAGVVAVQWGSSVGPAIQQIEALLESVEDHQWDSMVRHIQG